MNGPATSAPCLAEKTRSTGTGRWLCTEPRGHDGPHEAGTPDGAIVAVWPSTTTTGAEVIR